jgi:FixJ family two-component response regulator
VHAIADLLNICVATVHTHRARIMGKMNLKSNSDLTQYAVRNGLIDLLALVLIPGCYSSLHSFFTSF